MTIPRISPEEAKRMLDGDPNAVYLDVRTEAEFAAGRPTGALNVPVAQVDPSSGQMMLNPDFLEVVQAHLSPDTPVIVGCKAGPRSEIACKLLHQAGYVNVRDMIGGYSGVIDPTGRVEVEGWSTSGLPVEHGDASERSYQALSKSAGSSGNA